MGNADKLRRSGTMDDGYGLSFCWNRTVFIPFVNDGSYVIFLVTSREDEFLIDGERCTLSSGTLGLIGPASSMSLASGRITRCEMAVIRVSEEKLSATMSLLGLSLDDILSGSSVKAKLCDEALRDFIPLLTEVNYLLEKGASATQVGGAITDVLTHSLVTLHRALDEIRNENSGWFESLMRKLSAPEFISCRADDIYELAGFSAPVVIGAFRKNTGGGVSEYLQKRRIECARRLLEVTCLQLTDIYEFLGYSSLSHFIKLFRKYEGMTPGEYRSRYGISGLTSLTE